MSRAPVAITALALLLGPAAPFGATPAPAASAEGKPALQGPPAAGGPGRALKTRNVVFITLDGLRIQEMFAGMDPVVAADKERSGIYDPERCRRLYWRETPAQRRAALMPFFWGTLAPQGVVLGNKAAGSQVHPRNPHLYSTPGYAEIMAGRALPDLTEGGVGPIPGDTFLEFARRALGVDRMQVAAIASWPDVTRAAPRPDGALFTNAGYEAVPADVATPRMALLSEWQSQIMPLWETSRSDFVTLQLALEYLGKYRPRLLYIGLSDTDDWAHAQRYDRLLDDLHIVDGWLRALWETLESLDSHRGRTTLVLTTDHGRGVKPEDWIEHGVDQPGSGDVWIAVIGPDTPDRGEVGDYRTVYLADIAATILRLLGLDDRAFHPEAGPAIPIALGEEGPGAGGTEKPATGSSPGRGRD